MLKAYKTEIKLTKEKIVKIHKIIGVCRYIYNFYIAHNKVLEPIGVDLGLKELAIVSNEIVYKNVNKTSSVKKLEKKLKREQRNLSKK